MATESSLFTNLAGFQALIPLFDSESAVTPQYFVDTFETLSKTAKIPDAEKLLVLKSRIRGEALTNVINNPDLSQETNYKNFLTKFLNFFGKTENLASRQYEFSNCKMLTNEPAKTYAARITKSTLNFFGNIDLQNVQVKALVDNTKLAKFIDGLSPEFKKDMLMKNPKSFEDAIQWLDLLQTNAAYFANAPINNVAQSDQMDLQNLLQRHTQQTHESIAALSKKLEDFSIRRDRSKTPEIRGQSPHLCNRQPSPYRRYYYPVNQNDRAFSNPQTSTYRSRPRTPLRCAICHRSNHDTSRCFYNTRSNVRGQIEFERAPVTRNYARQNEWETVQNRASFRRRNVSPFPRSNDNNRRVRFTDRTLN